MRAMSAASNLQYSVIITTYQRVDWLAEALAGVAAQTMPPKRVVVADDGSDPSMSRQIRDLVALHGFEFVPLPHSGLPGVSRAQALSRVDTEWVALCDDDDVWDVDHMAHLSSLVAERVVLISGNARLSNSGRALRPALPDPVPLIHLFPSNPIVNSGCLVRRTSLLEVGGFLATPRGAEDYATWLRLATTGSVRVVNEPTLTYRVGGSSLGDAVAKARRPVELLCGLDFLVWVAGNRLTLPRFLSRVLTKLLQWVVRLLVAKP